MFDKLVEMAYGLRVKLGGDFKRADPRARGRCQPQQILLGCQRQRVVPRRDLANIGQIVVGVRIVIGKLARRLDHGTAILDGRKELLRVADAGERDHALTVEP